MWRMGVPVATPLTADDCWTAYCALGRRNTGLDTALTGMLGVPYALPVSSGRAALYLILQAMRHTSPRSEVIIPAFVCPSVGRAVTKAGLRPVLCDVSPRGFGLDLASLDRLLSTKTLAVIAAHLYGYVSDIRPVLEMAHGVRTMVIEDAAQAFGARLEGRHAGTWGDAGVISFGMSKVLGVGGGGIAATRDGDLGRQVARLVQAAPHGPRLGEVKALCKLALAGMLVRSHHLGPVASIWGGMMRGRDDCTDFQVRQCLTVHAGAARSALSRLNEITRIRQQNAAALQRRLSGFDGVELPEQTAGSEPAALRFPVIVHDVSVKQELLRRVRAIGINASEMYTRASYEAVRGFAWRRSPCPNTEYLADRMLNLPTHCYVRDRDVAGIAGIFASVLTPKRETETVAAIA